MVWAAAAVVVASAIASYMASKDGQAMTEEERAKMEELVGKLQSPNFDMNTIYPEEFKLVSAFVPEMVPVIEENAPEVIKKTADMEEGRSAQMDAMRYLKGLASQGQDPIAELDRIKGSREAAMEANTQRANIESSMARRGVGDSGLSIVAQQQAGGDAAYRTAMAGEQAARDALTRRAGAATQSADIGGQVFSQDQSIEAANANTINDFNARMAQRRQQLAQINVGAANTAGANAQQQQQSINNSNTSLRNTSRLAEQTRQNDLKQKQYENSVQKTGLMTGQGAGRISDIAASTEGTQKLYAGLGQVGASVLTDKRDKRDKYGNLIEYAD